MINSVHRYFRDGMEMDRVTWFHNLQHDMQADYMSELKITAGNVEEEADMMVDDDEGHCFNGHIYVHQAYMEHDDVHELMQTLTEFEYYDEIFNAVKKMPAEIIHRIVLAIEGPGAVTYQDGKYRV